MDRVNKVAYWATAVLAVLAVIELYFESADWNNAYAAFDPVLPYVALVALVVTVATHPKLRR